MPYELGITEVSPAEYPLIDVLRETVFGEVGHRSLSMLADDLEGKRDVLALLAHLEGNPVGFKVGHRDRAGAYYSKCGGVLKAYRRLGLARRMQDWQASFALARGYKTIYFNTFNHFPDMMRFGLRGGFLPIAAERRPLGGMSFKFERDLTDATPTPITAGTGGVEFPCSQFEIEHCDRAALFHALARGGRLCGIRHDFSSGKTFALVERS